MRNFTYSIPMHHGSHLVTLEEILALIDGTGLEWHLSFLDATSRPDSQLNVVQLGHEVRSRPGGYVYSDVEIRALARELDQVIDCDIFAFTPGDPFGDESKARLAVEAFDSTSWNLEFEAAEIGRLDVTAKILVQRH